MMMDFFTKTFKVGLFCKLKEAITRHAPLSHLFLPFHSNPSVNSCVGMSFSGNVPVESDSQTNIVKSKLFTYAEVVWVQSLVMYCLDINQMGTSQPTLQLNPVATIASFF